jgi:carboxyl-terminal processing protease
MIEALDDPYSGYYTPDEYEVLITHQQGTFGGIGATVGVRDGQIIVIAPIPGTPAAGAGVKSGDAIMAVNGELTEGLSIEDVVKKIRGPEGTSVKVTIKHEGESDPVEIEFVRAMIDVPSLSYEMRDDIAYIQIYYFSERTDEELIPVLTQLKDADAKGIILDLRSNPGGPVDTVVNVASHFLDSGVVLYLVDNKGKETSYSIDKQTEIRTNLPVVVLTDNYSASGSEVLSGALQDYRRAVVAGMTTFGKGSADRWFELSDGSAIYLTVSRWLTPNRRLIEGKGIEPDYKLDLKGDDLVNWAIDYLKGK